MSARPSGAQRLELFSPIPKHVMGDDRLTAGHHRLLLAIAWHSRFDDNGRGCYAKHVVLAEEADIDYTNVSSFAADLEAWGIITSERAPLDRRCRIYRLIFKEKKAIGGEHTNYSGESGENAPKNEIGGEHTTFQAKIVGGQKEEVTDSQQESAPQYIPLKGRENMPLKGIPQNTNSPAENHVERNPSTKWENLVPFKTAAST